jgi:glycogen operon protein
MNTTLPDTLEPGRPEVLGAEVCAEGVRFGVFSQRASAVALCVFDESGHTELRRYPLHGPDDGVFHGLLRDAQPGLLYGYRAHGSWRPENGRRFNPNKLLLDPYAREISGQFAWQPEHYGHVPEHPDGQRLPDPRDNGGSALKARVHADPGIAPGVHNRPRHPRGAVVLYELHVKGFSMSLPGIPDALRGTFAALAQPAAIAHFQRLGVTTLSLLPVHHALDERHLHARGLRNYWGYNTIGFFCPDPRLAADRTPGGAIAEFRNMVATLHAHGLEVVLDVVFNHTAEGDGSGPLLSFRGLDNASWYSLVADDRSRYENFSGCGNSVRVAHPRVTQFVLDALRWWVERMGVDGFRFDLATTLGRTRSGFDPAAPFFVALRQDPLLSAVHWIAEPWDCGNGGYQVGRFPGRFIDWNDRFRDAARGYWLGTGVGRGEFAKRITASSDLFHHGMRQPTASVNFVTAHDGFTLADVVSYSNKHNQANGEDNRDGNGQEISANFGVEGDTDDAQIADTRLRVRRALLATVLLSQGTPMLCAGDEFGNSQGGNNNAYCQDNPIGWLDWSRAAHDAGTIALVAQLIALRRQYPLLRYERWFESDEKALHRARLRWFNPSGTPMQIADWHDRSSGAFVCQLYARDEAVPRGAVLFNPDPEPRAFQMADGPWCLMLDSSDPLAARDPTPFHALTAPARCVLLLRADLPEETTP